MLSQKNHLINRFEDFSNNLGLAFQIRDDLLDVEGDEKKLGKKTKKDSSRGKQTLVSLIGKAEAKKKSKELINKSLELLKPYGERAKNLKNLTNFIISRNM